MNINWDNFFYYGENVIEKDVEDEFDVWCGILQPLKSLFYFREEGAGVSQSENLPNTLSLLMGLNYNITKWFAFRNSYVSDGRDNFPDRRIAVSQQTIGIEQDNQGNLNIDLFYISFSDYEKPKNIFLGI